MDTRAIIDLMASTAAAERVIIKARELREDPAATAVELRAQIVPLCGHLNSLLAELRILGAVADGAENWECIPEGNSTVHTLKLMRRAYETWQQMQEVAKANGYPSLGAVMAANKQLRKDLREVSELLEPIDLTKSWMRPEWRSNISKARVILDLDGKEAE